MSRSACLMLLVAVAALGPAPVEAQTLAPAQPITTTGPVAGSSMTLVWGAVPDATHYHIRLDDVTGSQLEDYYRPDQVGCTTGSVCELTVATSGLTPGVGQWWVQALEPDGGRAVERAEAVSLSRDDGPR